MHTNTFAPTIAPKNANISTMLQALRTCCIVFFLHFLLYSNVFTRTTATAAVAATATSMQREAPKKVPTIVHTRQARQSRRHCLHTKYQIKKYKEIATANINEGKTNNKIPHFLVGKLLNYFCYIV